MNKQINILAALLLCAQIAIAEQAIPNIKPEVTEHTRTGLINASNIMISSTLFKNETAAADTKIDGDIDGIGARFTKYGFDWATISLSLSTAVCTVAGIYYGSQKEWYTSASLMLLGMVDGYFTKKYIAQNLAQSNGQKYLSRPVDSAILLIHKKNGQLSARAYSNIHSNLSERELNKTQEELAQLAKEIIANHDESVENKDLYASELFAKLVKDFQASC